MKTTTYISLASDKTVVEELTRDEFVECAMAAVEAIGLGSDDDTLWVEYRDGSHCAFGYGCDPVGAFRRRGISWGLSSNGSTQQVFGSYAVDENGIVQRA